VSDEIDFDLTNHVRVGKTAIGHRLNHFFLRFFVGFFFQTCARLELVLGLRDGLRYLVGFGHAPIFPLEIHASNEHGRAFVDGDLHAYAPVGFAPHHAGGRHASVVKPPRTVITLDTGEISFEHKPIEIFVLDGEQVGQTDHGHAVQGASEGMDALRGGDAFFDRGIGDGFVAEDFDVFDDAPGQIIRAARGGLRLGCGLTTHHEARQHQRGERTSSIRGFGSLLASCAPNPTTSEVFATSSSHVMTF